MKTGCSLRLPTTIPIKAGHLRAGFFFREMLKIIPLPFYEVTIYC